MSLIKRMKAFITNILEESLWKRESRNPRLLIETTLRDYLEKQAETRKTLVSLVFQKKQLEAKLQRLNEMLAYLQESIEGLAAKNKDEEAINLMSKMESLQEERDFIAIQLGKLNSDIQMVKKMESDLKVKMILAREKMEVLSGRAQALRLRKKLKEGLEQIASGMNNTRVEGQVQKLEKEVYKLELENEDTVETHDLEQDFHDWKSQNSNEERRKKLVDLKKKLLVSTEVKRLNYICT